MGKGYFRGEGLLHCVKTESKICWTYEWDKKFVVIVKRMWKDSKFKNFILFVYYYLELLCYNSFVKMKQYIPTVHSN